MLIRSPITAKLIHSEHLHSFLFKSMKSFLITLHIIGDQAKTSHHAFF